MKAAFFLGPEKMEIREVEVPQVEEGEVLLRVAACAICGTDVRIFHHGHSHVQPPQTTGHEIAGEIVEVGKGVEGYKVGDKVVVITVISCGRCRYCRRGLQNLCPEQKYIGYDYPGGFAEFLKIPREGVERKSLSSSPRCRSFGSQFSGAFVLRGQWSILLEYRFRRKCFSHWSRTHWLHACGAGSKPRSREDIFS